MNIHEYQAKNILKDYQLPLPQSQVCFTPDEAYSYASQYSDKAWVVKAQVHTGGRGKAGGIKFAESPDQVRQYAQDLIGHSLVTHQTGPQGELIEAVLLEEPSDIKHEYYLSLVLDRSINQVLVMASAEGGMDIEAVAAETPEKILKEPVDPLTGLANFQANNLFYGLGLPRASQKQFVHLVQTLYSIYMDKDCSILEINPLVLTDSDELMILDAKFNFDENALYRQEELAKLQGAKEAESIENQASEKGLSYIGLDGDIGCLVNGAGLAMATMDVINYYGGSPANFLDLGGGANEEAVKYGFEIILNDDRVKGILVNIFGGIVRCDVIAKGIIAAAQTTDIRVPLVVRLDGTNAQEGQQILAESGLNIIAADSLASGAQKIIALAQ